jgi:hypothetical protein
MTSGLVSPETFGSASKPAVRSRQARLSLEYSNAAIPSTSPVDPDPTQLDEERPRRRLA